MRMRTVEARLGRLEVPVRELAPEEVVERAPGLPEVVLLVAVRHVVHHRVHLAHDPPLGERQAREARRVAELGAGERAALLGGHLLEVQEDELPGVPELVRQVAVRPEALEGQVQVHPKRRARREGEAQRVGPLLLDDVQRVDHVPEGLGHLAALRVADEAVEHDGAADGRTDTGRGGRGQGVSAAGAAGWGKLHAPLLRQRRRLSREQGRGGAERTRRGASR